MRAFASNICFISEAIGNWTRSRMGVKISSPEFARHLAFRFNTFLRTFKDTYQYPAWYIVTLLLWWRLWDSIGPISLRFHNTSVLTQSHGSSCVPPIIRRRGTLLKLLSLLQLSFFLLPPH